MLKTEIEFNLCWEVEVTLNEAGAEIWNDSVYGRIHGNRDAGHTVRVQLFVVMELFGREFYQLQAPIKPTIRLYCEEEVKPIRIEVSHFAEAMESKLKQNDNKAGWQDCDMEYLLNRLTEECAELDKAVDEDHGILEEAINVANFAMMIADRAGCLMRSRMLSEGGE